MMHSFGNTLYSMFTCLAYASDWNYLPILIYDFIWVLTDLNANEYTNRPVCSVSSTKLWI